jgi:putative spermidine/putrescine transport system permease protein
MIRFGEIVLKALGHAYLAAICIFMLAPIAIVLLVSLSPTPVFDIPTNDVSLQWYRKLPEMYGLWAAVRLSVEVAAIATVSSLVLGTLCALGILRGRFPGRNGLLVFVLSPMMLPGVVLGIAMLISFRMIGLVDGYPSLILAHVVITLPYVVRVLYAAFVLFDFAMIDAARTLGYNHGRALWHVLVPNVLPSFLTGGMFAFLTSLDNYALALFLGDVRNVTLPIQILNYLDRAADPSVAAIATMMVGLTVLILVIAERLVGARRLVGG